MSTVEKLGTPMHFNNETRLALLEQTLQYQRDSQQRIENSLHKVQVTIEDISREIMNSEIRLNQLMGNLFDKLNANNKWLIGLVLSMIFSICSLIVTLYVHFN